MKEKLKLALKDKDFSELLRGSGFSFFLRFGGLMSGYLLTLIIANLFGSGWIRRICIINYCFETFYSVVQTWFRYNFNKVYSFFYISE